MNSASKKISFMITSISIICLLILYSEKYLKLYIINYNNEIISDIIIRLILILVLMFIVRSIGLSSFIGLRTKGKFIYSKRLVLILAIFASLFIMLNKSRLISVDIDLISLFLFSCLLIGLFEELWIRGIILPLLLRAIEKSDKRFLVAVLFSSLIFSILHYLNLFNEENNFADISSQVLFAFAVGVVFGALTLRIGNILPTSIFHGVFNFSFGLNKILGNGNKESILDQTSKVENLDALEVTINVLILIAIIAVGIKLLMRVDKERIIKDLSKLKL